MNQADAQRELTLRRFIWSKKWIEEEVASDFQVFRSCAFPYIRDLICFLKWMESVPPHFRVSKWLSLVRRKNQIPWLKGTEFEMQTDDETVFREWGNAHGIAHSELPPTPDCNKEDKNFVVYDLKKGRTIMEEELQPIFGVPKRRKAIELIYQREIGEWVCESTVSLRSNWCYRKVECRHLLKRKDFVVNHNMDWWKYTWSAVGCLGLHPVNVPLLSVKHAVPAAKAIHKIEQSFVQAIPQFVSGLSA
jgi:hypothetical protein